MKKKVAIKSPRTKLEPVQEDWVSSRTGTKRLTIDVPTSLHAELKIASIKNNQTMGEMIRDCLQKYLADKND